MLHDNILPCKYRKDITDKYEILRTYTEGSMGYISLVKQREDAKGGSAFKNTSKKEKDVGVKALFLKLPSLRKKKDKKNKEFSSLSPKERRQIEVVYALKEIRLDRIRSEDSKMYLKELRNEISILKTLDHPNIVKAFEVYDDKYQIYVVMEFCYGGDLHDRAPYSEKRAASITKDLISAVKYMHEHGIVHRDLKEENIMFENETSQSRIKVIDFGLSNKFSSGNAEGHTMTAYVGTKYTMAPEVFRREYTSQVDLWSVGVIAYILLCNQFPFYHKNKKKMVEIIQRGKYSMDDAAWNKVSDDAKEFVKSLLVVDPKKRLNASQACESQWLKNQDLSDSAPEEDLIRSVENSLLHYRSTSHLKKIALNLIAKNSTSEEIVKLRKVFETFDKDNDGIVTFEEFKIGLQRTDYSDDLIAEIFESIDVNENGHIMYTEFLAATVEALGKIEGERIAEAFDRIDTDDTGYIDKKELVQILGTGCSKDLVDEIMQKHDRDNDGKIDFQDFNRLFRRSTILTAERISSINFDDIDNDSD